MTSLYIHIPFCERKCFYCSFAVSIAQEHRRDEYVAALSAEAGRYHGEHLKTIYLGGGTPSLLTPAQIERLFMMLRQRFVISPDCEITVEANPENLNPEKAKLLFSLGVNRVSLGIQTLNDAYLKYLGRVHDSFKALYAFRDLRAAGFKNINVDLMYSFLQQTPEQIEKDVKAVLDLGSEHVSIYTLTVEEHSKFYVQKIRQQDDHAQAEQYVLVTSLLNDAGMSQYEVSNFSRPGFESKHNINYWQGGNYIGLGMGSHGHLDGRRNWNTSRLADYLKKVQAQESPEEGHEVLSKEARLREALIFGLRMNTGVIVCEHEEKLNCQLPKDLRQQIDNLIDQGLLSLNGPRLQATAAGRLVLDAIAVKII